MMRCTASDELLFDSSFIGDSLQFARLKKRHGAKSASRCVAMVRGKNGTNPAAGGGSNGLRGYKLLRLPMVAGSPITRTGDEREISPKKHETKAPAQFLHN